MRRITKTLEAGSEKCGKTLSANAPKCVPLSDNELCRTLALALSSVKEDSIEVVHRRVVKTRNDWRGSRRFEKVVCHIGNSSRRTIFLKYYRPSDQANFLGKAADREAAVYRHLLVDSGLGAAAFYGFRRMLGKQRWTRKTGPFVKVAPT